MKKTTKKNETATKNTPAGKLSAATIKQLMAQGCTAENWDNVKLENVDISRLKDVSFLGVVSISNLNGSIKYHKDFNTLSSITRATLIDTSINGNVYINNVGRFISNYDIEDGVIIENVGSIHTTDRTYFGNGTSVSAVSEDGGRAVRIYNRLDSHSAYILVMYREKTLMREKMDALIDAYIEKKYRTRGTIKNNAKIINVRVIKNAHIDPYATIENVDKISNTTIISTQECSSYIGSSVILIDCIVLKGAYITDGTIVSKSFVGEGVKLSKQFSCENSLLFANCEGQHGEMFSIFAAPYTVTHHKATLLIASHFSFFNAGSATNQSNHMYKLGPCHQGFMERGCKTGSNSYILWPSYIGAFTTVLGAHYSNVDSSDFPFSYLIEHKDHDTRLIPAHNLFGVGICRDETKWQTRDMRIGNKKDYVVFDVFSPYTVSKMLKAEKLLNIFIKENMSADDFDDVEPFFTYNKMFIKKSSLPKYKQSYTLAIDLYLHNILLDHIKNSQSFDEITNKLQAVTGSFYDTWVDIAGLIAPKNKVDTIITSLENDKIKEIRELSAEWKKLYESYKNDEWAWVHTMFETRYMINLSAVNKSQIKSILKKHVLYINEATALFENDIKKEFSIDKQVSFGIDNPLARQMDFDIVRGTVDNNPFVVKYRENVKEKLMNIESLLSVL